MSETQARATNRSIRIGNRPMTRVKRAVEKGEAQGFMKVIVDGQSNEFSVRPFSVPAVTRRCIAFWTLCLLALHTVLCATLYIFTPLYLS